MTEVIFSLLPQILVTSIVVTSHRNHEITIVIILTLVASMFLIFFLP